MGRQLKDCYVTVTVLCPASLQFGGSHTSSLLGVRLHADRFSVKGGDATQTSESLKVKEQSPPGLSTGAQSTLNPKPISTSPPAARSYA